MIKRLKKMKWVKKENEETIMNKIILTRYGHTDVSSVFEPAICSLQVVAKVLNLHFDEVRRLYRRFFSKSKPVQKFLSSHHNYLFD